LHTGVPTASTCRLDNKDTADMIEYVVTIEGHQAVALIDQFGFELSMMYPEI
jgi:hypothetical protein